MKTALITGITGMDGSYLAELLLSKGYKVIGLERHKSLQNRSNISAIESQIEIVKGDLSDRGSILNIVERTQPDEIYNLAAQSFAGDSWDLAEQTCNITGMGVLRILEVIHKHNPKIKFLQASSSEMFGQTNNNTADENTRFHPRSPYGVAKTFGHLITQNYRESYGMFACSSICFNHESERRGVNFVTRKITDGVAKIVCGKEKVLTLGSLDTKRDWGYAPEYVDGMWRMLQQNAPEDFVFATGETHTIEEFLIEAFKIVGIDAWRNYVLQDPQFMRPAETQYLLGDYSKAKAKLNWEPTVRFKELVSRMVLNDIKKYEGMNGK